MDWASIYSKDVALSSIETSAKGLYCHVIRDMFFFLLFPPFSSTTHLSINNMNRRIACNLVRINVEIREKNHVIDYLRAVFWKSPCLITLQRAAKLPFMGHSRRSLNPSPQRTRCEKTTNASTTFQESSTSI